MTDPDTGQGPPAGTITVYGSGHVDRIPDEAEVQLGVNVVRPSVAAAREEAALRMQRVVEAVRDAGVQDRDVRTSQVSIGPHHEYPPEGGQRLAGYEVVNRIAVTVRTLDGLAGLVDGAVDASATGLEGVAFRLAQPEEAQREALSQAMADARRKAEVLAASAGQRVVGVRSIAEQSVGGPVPRLAARLAEMASDTPIAPGSTEVGAAVSVVFSVEPTGSA